MIVPWAMVIIPLGGVGGAEEGGVVLVDGVEMAVRYIEEAVEIDEEGAVGAIHVLSMSNEVENASGQCPTLLDPSLQRRL